MMRSEVFSLCNYSDVIQPGRSLSKNTTCMNLKYPLLPALLIVVVLREKISES